MDDFWDLCKNLGPIFIGTFLVIYLMCWSLYKANVEIFQANIVTAYVDGEKVYEGKMAFLSVTSGGMTTTLIIYKNLFPTIADKAYSSNDIKVVPN